MSRADRPGAARLREMESQARLRSTAVQDIVMTDASMTPAELEAAERVITDGRDAFVSVGQALTAIRDGRGYRHRGYSSFEDYLREVWGWGRRHGYNLIAAAEAAANVQSIAHPSLTQAIHLASLPIAEQVAVAREVDLSVVSTRDLRDEVARRKPAARPPAAVARPGDHPPLLRFCPPGMTSAWIVNAIVGVCFPDARTALDPTFGEGAFWKNGTHLDLTAHDSLEERAPNGVVDFRNLPYIDQQFDLVVFDPPHIADAGADSIMGQRYGTYSSDELLRVIWTGTREAWRVARLGIIVKVTDGVHGQEYVEESAAVRMAAGRPYDIVYQTREASLPDPKWGEQLSAYNNGSTYLIFRKDGPKHVRRGS